MSVVGDSALWREALIDVYEQVRDAILRVWPACCVHLRGTVSGSGATTQQRRNRPPREDPITRRLVVRLKQDASLRTRMFIESQYEILPGSMEVEPNPVGYLDIAILFFAQTDRLCFAMECKRLNVPREQGRATLAREYVENGMMRFVTGQYSPDLPLGGMVGYVMDGDTPAAYTAIVEQIEQHAAPLLCDAARLRVIWQPTHFATEHARIEVPIELRHLLLSVN
jgi:hypothetical protein